MQRYTSFLALGLVFIAGAAAAAPPLAQEYTGRGTQVYRCETKDAAPAWQLLGPDAHMYDSSGKIVARHFYGPSWQANDGSEIKGKVLVANASPNGPANAPWLVLRVILMPRAMTSKRPEHPRLARRLDQPDAANPRGGRGSLAILPG